MNFNDILQKELLQNECKKDVKICHITFEPLEKDYILLACEHTFNYNAIFKEVCIQKTVVNKKEIQRVPKYSIKCPYCRHVQKGILPYRKPYEAIWTVNTPKSKEYIMKKECKYIFSSGKNKGNACSKKSKNEHCPRHQKIVNRRLQKLNEPINELIEPINELNEPINELIEPINELNEPINEIITSNTQLDSIQLLIDAEQWREKCEKKHKHHPIFSNGCFVSHCEHVFKKGTLKGKKCYKCCNVSSNVSSNKSPVYYKNVFCKNHSKLKCNKNNSIIKPYYIPLYKDGLSKDELNKFYKDFVNSQEYVLIENTGFYIKKECYLAKKAIGYK